ncbi:hypothetical protein [Mycobacterium servetii]|uniref:Uncharacterized protein n=1 Tax=Mycobacterium servetii TaxID=3237418 RepID=A0ABV4C8D1_9MYCO
MTYPHQFGVPQIVLAGVALIAVVMLVSSVVGRRRKVRPGAGSAESARRGSRLRFRPLRPVTGVVLLVVSLLMLWFATLVQTYLGLTGEVKAAHVVATEISKASHRLSVDLTLHDERVHASTRRSYEVEGDLWAFQAAIVELRHRVNVLGMHSGYKVTRLFGERLAGVSPAQHQISLNGGDGNFFAGIRGGRWWTKPFVRSAYGNAVISPPGEFDVYVSQDAIKARTTNG